MLTEPDPATAFTRLNSLMIRSGLAGRFVTLVAAILDPASHTVTLVNAGHPPPLIYHRAARTVAEAISYEVAGFPLGVFEGFEYPSCQVSLEPGDSILVLTDGVTDAMNVQDQQLQTKGVYAAVQGGTYSPRVLVEQVVKFVKEFAAGRSQIDDIALVCFGRT
jgi:serine phosphatase RsbU (regulator of sigma subunit)